MINVSGFVYISHYTVIKTAFFPEKIITLFHDLLTKKQQASPMTLEQCSHMFEDPKMQLSSVQKLFLNNKGMLLMPTQTMGPINPKYLPCDAKSTKFSYYDWSGRQLLSHDFLQVSVRIEK